MAIGPDGQEDMHVGMASFPQPASSRARPSAPTMDQAIRQMGLREWSSDPRGADPQSFALYDSSLRLTSQTMPEPRSNPVNSRTPSGEDAITVARPSPGSIVRI